MKRSTTRILTTHTGSLPRPVDLIPLLFQPPTDRFSTRVQEAVAEAVHRQVAAGIDIISDGEQGRTGFHFYVINRLSGFVFQKGPGTWMPQDIADHPDLQRKLSWGDVTAHVPLPVCEGPVTLADPGAIGRDIATFKQALQGVPYVEAFMTAASPGVIASAFPDRYYREREAYVHALARALAPDYKAIVAAGFVLQVDCPDLALDRQLYFADAPLPTFRQHIRQSIAALNEALALAEIRPEQVRVHVCHGNYPGPHHRDVALADILDLLLGIHAQGLSIVAANSQHRTTTFQAIAHLVQTQGWPKDKILLPGAIDTLSPVEEHAESVAELLEQYAVLVGREQVIACTDCGFGTIVGPLETIVPSAVWERLHVLAAGARLASQRLWREA
jgi:5-methyltetrahydropteroyltriglutamate--homocysteine methyltransferase